MATKTKKKAAKAKTARASKPSPKTVQAAQTRTAQQLRDGILAALKGGKQLSARQIQAVISKEMDVARTNLAYALRVLQDQGRIVPEGNTRTRTYSAS